jgi:hypothetical protein
MATANPLPAPIAGKAADPDATGSNEIPVGNALLPAIPNPEEGNSVPPSGPFALLPVELDVSVPVRDFRVRNLLALVPGQLIESQWVNGADVPLASGEVRLAWSEFEVIDTRLAVRVTRLL